MAFGHACFHFKGIIKQEDALYRKGCCWAGLLMAVTSRELGVIKHDPG